jgi:hypothetical protein
MQQAVYIWEVLIEDRLQTGSIIIGDRIDKSSGFVRSTKMYTISNYSNKMPGSQSRYKQKQNRPLPCSPVLATFAVDSCRELGFGEGGGT